MDTNTVLVTARVLCHLGLDEFYNQVDAYIEAHPDVLYKDALASVVQTNADHISNQL
jgi:hypothetical protein